MKMNRFIYPVDTCDFASIREAGKVYVDKTDLIYRLVSTYNYVFLDRPRRFGKSLLCSTFKAYFNGNSKLFDGLRIAELEKEWRKYPVFHFSMSGLKDLTLEDAKTKLGNYIEDYEQIYGRNEKEVTPGARFRGLIHRAAAQTGEKVVVIIDEYDAPIMRLLHQKERMEVIRSMLREFYQVLKDEDEYIRFVFLTGITKFSQLSIFSELNNLKNISAMPEYSGLCGITQNELDTTLRPCVEDFAEGYGCTTDEAYALLRKQYDGYHFCGNSQDVYAPFSLLNALSDKAINDYWFTGATPTTLIDHLRHYPIASAIEYDGVDVNLGQFYIPCEDAPTPMPLLYQSGYLSIDTYDKRLNSYRLHFPNQEVRNGMVDCLMPIILHRSTADNNALVLEMARAIYNGDLATALLHLRAYIAAMPYDIMPEAEWADKQKREWFYKLLFYLVFSTLNTKVDTEVRSILGRADVVIQTEDDVFVIELKEDHSVKNALDQIDRQDYAIRWEANGRRVTKCGVRIGSDRRNITHFKLTDAEGRKIVERKFNK